MFGLSLVRKCFGRPCEPSLSPQFKRDVPRPSGLISHETIAGAKPASFYLKADVADSLARALMAPAFFIELDTRTGRRPRGISQVARVTAHARHSGGATAAGAVAIPRLRRVVFAHPTAIATGGAGRHQRSPGHHVVGGLNADTRSELGFRTDKSFLVQDGVLILRTRFGWAHDFDPDRSIAATFQALPGASFVVNGAAQASDTALTTASIEMKWKNGWSAAATFEGEFSDVTSSYAGKGVVRYQW